MTFTYETEEQVIEAGERLERARYWQAVRDIAEEIVEEYPRKSQDTERDERLWEEIDGSAWIIYTGQNLDVLRFTENDDAYTEVGELETGDAYKVYSQVAFYAMRADTQAAIERLLEERGDEDDDEEDEDDA